MRKKGFFIVCLLFVFCRCGDDMGTLIPSPQECIPDVDGKYEYPYGRQEEYGKFISYDKIREEQCQVPASAAKKMSTLALIRTLLDTPCLSGVRLLASSDLSAINRRNDLSWYNTTKELLSRREAARALLTFYGAIHFDCVASMDTEQEWDFFAQVSTLELLFTEETILNQLDAGSHRQLVNILLEKHRGKEQIKEQKKIGVLHTYSVFAMLHTMLHANYQPVADYVNQWGESSEEKEYLLDGYYSTEQVEDIISFAEIFVENLK
jgi:hypothetical protein